MRGVNRVTILGNLGRDPEVRYTQGGAAVANFSVATSEAWNDKATGERKEQTEWHRIVCFGRLAEIAGEFLRKGSKVYIEGSLRTRTYDKDGQTHYATEINARELQMLDGRNASENAGASEGAEVRRERKAAAKASAPELDYDDLSVPF